MVLGLVIALALIALVIVGLVVFCAGIYNRLVVLKVDTDRTWSNIEVLQKQRYDEIPKLVTVCEGYMKHERETLEKVTQARTSFMSASSPADMAKADGMMAGALKTLFAVAENYPELKANENFRHLQGRISTLENEIAGKREGYNSAAATFNTAIRQIPDVLIATLLQYRDREMYRIPEGQQEAPEIKFEFSK